MALSSSLEREGVRTIQIGKKPPNVVDPTKLTSKGLASRERMQWTKLLKDTDKVSLNKAEALHKLIIKNIKRQLLEVPKGRKEFIELAQKHGINERNIKSWLKKTDRSGGYRAWKDIADQEKSLRRALGEFLTTSPEFLNEQGILQVLTENSERVTGDYLADYLKGWDSYFSGEKAGKVVHHQTLSSLRDMLKEASPSWVKKFNQLAKDSGFQIGDKGGLKIDPIAHMPFNTPKANPNVWNIKGVLADMLATPDSKFTPKGALIIAKNDGSKAAKIIRRLEEMGAHSTDYGGTRGYFADKNLAKLAPEDAFKSVRNVLGAELQIGQQGSRIDKSLTNWQKWAKKGNKTTEEALDGLGRILDHRKPESIASLITEAELDKIGPTSPIDPTRYTPPNAIQGPKLPEPKGGVLSIAGGGKRKFVSPAMKRLGLGAAGMLGLPIIGGQQGHAAGMYQQTGDKKYLKDLGIATGRDFATGSVIGITGKAIAKRQLTKGLIRQGIVRGGLGLGLRGAVGAAVPILGLGLAAYSAYDMANQYSKATTGKGLVGRAKDLLINKTPSEGITAKDVDYFKIAQQPAVDFNQSLTIANN